MRSRVRLRGRGGILRPGAEQAPGWTGSRSGASYGEALQLSGDPAAAREVLVAAAGEASATGRAVDLARAALALGGGLTGFEVRVWTRTRRTCCGRLTPRSPRMTSCCAPRSIAGCPWRWPGRRRSPSGASGRGAVRMARSAGDGDIESAMLAAFVTRSPDRTMSPSASPPRPACSTWPAARRALPSAPDECAAGPPPPARRPPRTGQPRRHPANRRRPIERLAPGLGVPRYGWLPEIWRGMRALLDGHPDLALRHAAAARDISRRAAASTRS